LTGFTVKRSLPGKPQIQPYELSTRRLALLRKYISSFAVIGGRTAFISRKSKTKRKKIQPTIKKAALMSGFLHGTDCQARPSASAEAALRHNFDITLNG
jgi:hypothetical protein